MFDHWVEITLALSFRFSSRFPYPRELTLNKRFDSRQKKYCREANYYLFFLCRKTTEDAYTPLISHGSSTSIEDPLLLEFQVRLSFSCLDQFLNNLAAEFFLTQFSWVLFFYFSYLCGKGSWTLSKRPNIMNLTGTLLASPLFFFFYIKGRILYSSKLVFF
jgi:hypothetical protein